MTGCSTGGLVALVIALPELHRHLLVPAGAAETKRTSRAPLRLEHHAGAATASGRLNVRGAGE
eukprot:2699505-Pyramimonas_sp.AAC.1